MAGKRTIPNWLKGFLDFEGAQKIEHAVARAELKTEAEIVPMIVKSSSSKGFLPLQIFLILSLIEVLLVHELEYYLPPSFSAYGFLIGIALNLPVAMVLARFHWIQRSFIPKADQIADVEHRAVYEYHHKKIGLTRHQTGVLIFVSLMEHRAVILAEGEIMAKIDSKLWNEAIEKLLTQIKAGDVATGFIEAIDLCIERLSTVSPPRRDNPNQISNHLIIEE